MKKKEYTSPQVQPISFAESISLGVYSDEAPFVGAKSKKKDDKKNAELYDDFDDIDEEEFSLKHVWDDLH